MENKEPFRLDYSTKNIPIPTEKEYTKFLITKTEKFIKNLRWRAFFFLNPELDTSKKETFGFNTTKSPPYIYELKEFEDGLHRLISSIKFQKPYIKSKFQTQLSKELRQIKQDEHIYVPADKTTNMYKLKPSEYENLVNKSLVKEYHRSKSDSVDTMIQGDKTIAEKLKLSDRIDVTAKREAFITLKDHKDNFNNNLPCRLLNPCKSEIGKISKQILEKIILKVKTSIELNQWKNTDEVIKWFINIDNKEQYRAISFDICDFYPSITKETLSKAITFARKYCPITKEEEHIILHTKSSTLYHNKEPWNKNKSQFDVAMGSYDGAETCELVGLFLLFQLRKVDANIGLYRDDGLAACRKNPQSTEKIKKEICQILKENGFNITITPNLKIVDFLDVTLDFETGTFRPYAKPNNKPLYVHAKSNHPPSIIRQIPNNVNRRISSLSFNETIYKQSIGQYEKELKKSGHDTKIDYVRNERACNDTEAQKQSRKRKRNITWFNPPFSENTNTNIGKKTLDLIDKCFPKGHKLHKICNRNTIKISYCCMPNVGKIINSHNKKIIQKKDNQETNEKSCNCRNKRECPLENKCQTKCVVYQATVETPNKKTETYIGVTENTFKTRYLEHTSNFRNINKRYATTLSEHIWKIKDKNEPYNIKWKIIEKTPAYDPATKICKLCTAEKYYIITQKQNASLNKRNELVSTCRHRNKYLLKNFQPRPAERKT